jgi:hypothetical protein
MLPPELAAFSFGRDTAGSDEAIAARTAAAARIKRILVVGAGRPKLIQSLARMVDHVVSLDTSRGTLKATRAFLDEAGVSDSVTLFAADPRDFVVPDGADAVLVTSLNWRALTARNGRDQMLECAWKTLSPGGWLFLDVDRLPPSTTRETEKTLLRVGPERRRWWWWRDPTRELVTVRLEAPGAVEAEVELADVSPERAQIEIEESGFRIWRFADPSTGLEPTELSERVWIAAQPESSGLD